MGEFWWVLETFTKVNKAEIDVDSCLGSQVTWRALTNVEQGLNQCSVGSKQSKTTAWKNTWDLGTTILQRKWAFREMRSVLVLFFTDWWSRTVKGCLFAPFVLLRGAHGFCLGELLIIQWLWFLPFRSNHKNNPKF